MKNALVKHFDPPPLCLHPCTFYTQPFLVPKAPTCAFGVCASIFFAIFFLKKLMKSLIIVILFVGMFLVVQSVYEHRIKDLENAEKKIEYRYVQRPPSNSGGAADDFGLSNGMSDPFKGVHATAFAPDNLML